MHNILKTLHINIKMVSDIFHNMGVMIDPKRKKSSCCFPGEELRGGAQGGKGRDRGGKCTILGHLLAFS